MTPDSRPADISIVLVEPARGGNVGAAARAMKTMGFTDLRIVGTGPDQWNIGEARAFAHGSSDVLDGAGLHGSLEEALEDRDLVVGTTARRRGKRDDYYEPPQLREMLGAGLRGERIALVFGREESGLSNEELDLCHITTAIPMRAAYPSLNLAQAVMVYCYELSSLRFHAHRLEHGVPEEATMSVLHRRASETLLWLGFDPGRALYRRILERIGAATRTDAHLMLSVIKAIGQLPSRER
ncbi:MAG: tRNA/rRNA methyltransferase [Spirochaetaceae bacterium]|nr:MAG: tRNA/rRNA methyltransferase [Spirochaetaceae bacterium]